MTTKNVIKAWKNAELLVENSPVGASQVNSSVLAQVQGGRNNVVTGCIPGPKFPKDGDSTCGIVLGGDILVLA